VENLSAAHGTQVSSLAAPAAMEYVPAPQLLHVSTLVAPAAVEYLPAAHCTHVLQSAAYCPAAHTTGAGVVMGSAVVVVGSGVVLEVVGSGVVLEVVGSGVVLDVVGSGVVLEVVGSGVVLEVVGSGVVLDVVGSGVVLDVLVALVAYWPARHVEGAGQICLMYSTYESIIPYPYSDHPSSSAFPYVHRHATWSSGESAGESPFT
jgi:hypothetical protein